MLHLLNCIKSIRSRKPFIFKRFRLFFIALKGAILAVGVPFRCHLYIRQQFFKFNGGVHFMFFSNMQVNIFVDVLPIAKARGFWDTDEPCYQMTVLRVLSAMDNALPIFIV